MTKDKQAWRLNACAHGRILQQERRGLVSKCSVNLEGLITVSNVRDESFTGSVATDKLHYLRQSGSVKSDQKQQTCGSSSMRAVRTLCAHRCMQLLQNKWMHVSSKGPEA